MFGSKLRSWMENHIGRPRKKNNKNKTTNGVNEATNANSNANYNNANKPNGKIGYTVCAGNVSTTTNGAYINCSGIISSPVRRREVSPIQNHARSRYGWHSPDHNTANSPKSDNLLSAPQHNGSGNFNNVPVMRNKNGNEEKTYLNPRVNCSSTSISSLSWSTGSKEPSMHSTNVQKMEIQQSNGRNSIDVEVPNSERIIQSSNKGTVFQHWTDSNVVHYEEICTTLRHPDRYADANFVYEERPKSDQFTSIKKSSQQFCNIERYKDEPSARYGRLLPSRLQKSVTDSFESIDENNGIHQRTSYDYNVDHTGLLKQKQNTRTLASRLKKDTDIVPKILEGAPINHVGTTLSSPESAYSTGYSTDGTSPGGNYNAPEYYINIRTGTHYFPKSINSLTIEAQRYKFGLNKIEEMSPLEPLPKQTFATGLGNTDECNANISTAECTFHGSGSVGCHSPLSVRNTSIVLPALQGFETNLAPSPRQRCRIRTNPWYSTNENLNPAPPAPITTTFTTKSLTSSGALPQYTNADVETNLLAHSKLDIDPKTHNGQRRQQTPMQCQSSDSCSSSVDVDNNLRTFSPSAIGIMKKTADCEDKFEDVALTDDEATLNEMMGKFDESYIYEKETDILSDSDPTDCQSDLDTGRDAGDECDTDELLDIDFIDTASIQEVLQVNDNTGSCYYFSNSPVLRAKQNYETRRIDRRGRSLRSAKKAPDTNVEVAIAAQTTSVTHRRRKRFHKTRKKSTEGKERFTIPLQSSSRESRSVGGTPVCLRRNQTMEKDKNSTLNNRSNSLVLSDLYTNRSMAVTESERIMIKADLEADVKYRQLILEAESLLVSMKSSLQSLPRETPVSSPRRLNPLANKRVEMLKNSEPDTKKGDRLKAQQQQQQQQQQLKEQELITAINKRIEVLKYVTPTSPTASRVESSSPRKTHLTNFINQNGATELAARKSGTTLAGKLPQSPQLKLNGRSMQTPNDSPYRRRRIVSEKRKPTASSCAFETDSDTDMEIEITKTKYNNNESSKPATLEDTANYNYLPEIARVLLYNQMDYDNHNVHATASICPQSEPLKRKIYKGSSTFERIKQNLHLDAETCQQTNSGSSQKCSQQTQSLSAKNSNPDISANMDDSKKQQLILSTIADIKRSLETQSYELNGLNCD